MLVEKNVPLQSSNSFGIAAKALCLARIHHQADIDAVLYDALGQRIISTIFTQASQYRVILEVKPEFRDGPESLGRLYVSAPGGAQVPLSNLAKFREQPAQLAV